MKSMMAAAVLAGILMAPALSAGEPNAEAAKAIAEIEARRQEKADAASKAATAAAGQWRRDGKEGVIVTGPGGAISTRNPEVKVQVGK